jgi:hypothetical protein
MYKIDQVQQAQRADIAANVAPVRRSRARSYRDGLSSVRARAEAVSFFDSFWATSARWSRDLISIHNGMPTATSNAVQTSKISTASFMCIDYRLGSGCAWTNVTIVRPQATGTLDARDG